MAQILTTTGAPHGYDITALYTSIAATRSRVQSGKAITVLDMAEIVAAYNAFVSHYHPISDLRGIDTEGNVAVYGGGTYTTTYTSLAPGYAGASHASYIGPDSQVSAAGLNALIALINTIRSHSHSVVDVTA